MVLERPRHHVTVGAARVAEACASRVTTREGRDTVLSSFSFPPPLVVLDCVGSMTGRDAHCEWRVEATCNLRFPAGNASGRLTQWMLRVPRTTFLKWDILGFFVLEVLPSLAQSLVRVRFL